MKRFALPIVLGSLGALAACQSKPAPPTAEAPVHNAFVDHVERGHATMDKAQDRASAENARLKAQDQAAQQIQ